MSTKHLAASLMAMSMYGGDVFPGSYSRVYRSPEKAVICGLPDCTILTTHNGGYCCAEHSKQHRLQERAAKRNGHNT